MPFDNYQGQTTTNEGVANQNLSGGKVAAESTTVAYKSVPRTSGFNNQDAIGTTNY